MLTAAGTAPWEGGVKGWVGLPMGSRIPGSGRPEILALFSQAGIRCISRLGDCGFAFRCCGVEGKIHE